MYLGLPRNSRDETMNTWGYQGTHEILIKLDALGVTKELKGFLTRT